MRRLHVVTRHSPFTVDVPPDFVMPFPNVGGKDWLWVRAVDDTELAVPAAEIVAMFTSVEDDAAVGA